jgi:hypothetical protein
MFTEIVRKERKTKEFETPIKIPIDNFLQSLKVK